MTLSLPSDPTDAVFSDEARAARAARRLRTLEELAEIGMDIARALQRRGLDEAARTGDGADTALGLAFARVSRAVRQTLALEDKLDRPPQAPGLTPEAERAARLAELRDFPEIVALSAMILKDEVRAKVEQTIASESDGSDAERLLSDLEEHLDAFEAAEDFFDRPVGEMVARICRDLGVTPDWSLWENEDWAMDEAKTKPPGSPYARPRPIKPWPAWSHEPAAQHHPP